MSIVHLLCTRCKKINKYRYGQAVLLRFGTFEPICSENTTDPAARPNMCAAWQQYDLYILPSLHSAIQQSIHRSYL